MEQNRITRLVEKAILGDREAFVQLCEEKSRDILYICSKITGSLEDGQDAAQEVLLQLQADIGKLKSAEAFGVWCNRIIAHTCLRLQKRERRARGGLGMDELLEQAQEDRLDFLPPEYAENREDKSTVLEALDELKPNYRAVLLYFYFEELTLEQIAEAMQTTPGAARVTLHRARGALRKAVERKNGVELPVRAQKEGDTPVLGLILQQEAGQLAAASISQVVAAAGISAAGAGAAAAAGAGAAAATATAVAGGNTLAGLLLPVLGLLAAGSTLAATVYLVSPSSHPQPSSPENVPQNVLMEAQTTVREDVLYDEFLGTAQEPDAPSTAASLVPVQDSFASQPESGDSPSGSENENALPVEESSRSAGASTGPSAPGPAPGSTPGEAPGGAGDTAAPALLEGQVAFVDGAGETVWHKSLDFSAVRLELVSNGQVTDITPARDGSFQISLPGAPAAGAYLRWREKGGFPTPVGSPARYEILHEADGYGCETLRLTDDTPPVVAVEFYDKEGVGQDGNIDPAVVEFLFWDDTFATLEWAAYHEGTGRLAAKGEGEAFVVKDELEGSHNGERYTITCTVKDLAGNETTVSRHCVLFT